MDQIEEFLLSLDNIYPQIEGYLSTKINYPVKVEIKNKGVKVLEFFNNIVKNYPNNIIENIEFDINEELLMFKFTSTVDTIHELRLLHNGEKKLKDVLDNNFKSYEDNLDEVIMILFCNIALDFELKNLC